MATLFWLIIHLMDCHSLCTCSSFVPGGNHARYYLSPTSHPMCHFVACAVAPSRWLTAAPSPQLAILHDTLLGDSSRMIDSGSFSIICLPTWHFHQLVGSFRRGFYNSSVWPQAKEKNILLRHQQGISHAAIELHPTITMLGVKIQREDQMTTI